MKVYIAGPYTKGDVAVNVRNAILAADAIHALGHSPFIPHLTHFWHLLCPKPYEDWLAIDLVWLRHCDAVLRIPGESSGADAEIEMARVWGLPIYHSIEEFERAYIKKAE